MLEVGDSALDGRVHCAIFGTELTREGGRGAHKHREEERGLRQRAHDLTVRDSLERLVMHLGFLLGEDDEFFLLREAHLCVRMGSCVH